MSSLLTEEELAERVVVRTPRASVLLIAEVEHFGWSRVTRHRVRDISVTGARIDDTSELASGEQVAVTIGEERDVPATVIWHDRHAAGLRFTREINLDRARARVAFRSPTRR